MHDKLCWTETSQLDLMLQITRNDPVFYHGKRGAITRHRTLLVVRTLPDATIAPCVIQELIIQV